MNIKVENVKIENLTICNDCDEKFSFPNDTNSLSIDSEPEVLKKIKENLRNSDDLDEITNKLGIPSKLFNFHLATAVNLKHLNINGLNNAINIPASISKKYGGRNSIYKLQKGESTLIGIYVNDTGILMRTMERLSGNEEIAETGDSYKFSLTNLKGKLFYEGIGILEMLDKEKGEGKIKFRQSDSKQVAYGVDVEIEYSHIWSMYKIKVVVKVD